MIYIDLYTKIENCSSPYFTIGKVYSSQNANFSIDSGDTELTGWQTISGSLSVPSGKSCFFCNPNAEWGDVLLAYVRSTSGSTFNVHAGTKYVIFTVNSYNYMKVVDTKGNVRFVMIDNTPNDAAVSGVRIQGTDLSNLV